MRVPATLLAAAILAAPAFAHKKENKGPVFEPNTYRFGGTYTVVGSQSPSQCSASCERDANCKAWSYVDLPGGAAQNACELKSTLGKSEDNPTSVSGISPRVEKYYQPSPYNTRRLVGEQGFTAEPSRRLYSETRTVPAAPATITSRAPRTYVAPAAPATVYASPPRRVAAPAAPATITSKSPLYKTPPAVPATATSSAPTKVAAPKPSATVTYRAPAKPAPRAKVSVPVVQAAAPKPPVKNAAVKSPLYKTPPTAPVAVAKPSAPTPKPQPKVQFAPLKPSADGSYRPVKPSKVYSAAKPAKKDEEVVLNSEMSGASVGGVGETPAAPIVRNAPTNAQGERVPYKDISAREYPNYSVTRAAEQGSVAPVGTEDLGTTLPQSGN